MGMRSNRILTCLLLLCHTHRSVAFLPPLPAPHIVQNRDQPRLQLAAQDEESGLQNIKAADQDFWARQKELVDELNESNDKSARQLNREKFAQRRLALVGDTAYFGFFLFCGLWLLFANPFVAFSYGFGTAMGLAYAYGLGRYVEALGGSVDDEGAMQGAGVGEARFAFLILLFVIVGKFRSEGLLELPAIAGFFTYQLASLNQGLREIND